MTIKRNGTVQRLDFSAIKNAKRTPQGGLRIPASVTRTGILVYTRADGTVAREFRPADEVFKADSLETLKGAPVTDLHPRKMVGPDNWRKVSIGHVTETVKEDGKFVSADVLVQDALAVKKIDTGDLKEISCGYSCMLDPTPGEHEGEHYDAVQRDISYNHVAIGPEKWGRAGGEVALRLDGGGNVVMDEYTGVDYNQPAKDKREIVPMKLRIDEIDFDLASEAGVQAVTKALQKRDGELAEHKAQLEKLQGRLDGLSKDSEETKKKLIEAEDPKRVDSLVAARVLLHTQARTVLGDEAKLDGKSEREIMEEVLRKRDAEAKFDGLSDDYMRGKFEAAVEFAAADKKSTKRNDALGDAHRAAQGSSSGDQRLDADKAEAANIERSQDAWKQPLAFSKVRETVKADN